VKDVEELDPPLGRGERITRIERFGLNINRVDSFEVGLGGEFVHDEIRPDIDWSIDVPRNRQAQVCTIDADERGGDLCLGEAAGFSTSPSRFTLGARLYPWSEHGFSITAGADIGTGAVILPGVSIGRRAIIGAGAVVTKSVPAYAIAAGVPARVLRRRRT
jgi:hypothetical protein